MGGRIASQVVSSDCEGINRLVLLGYPLHPPGRPDKLRDKHLPHIRVPMLFVQGSRDTFGTPGELRSIIKRLKTLAELYVVEDGDHSFKVPKKAPLSQQAAYGLVFDAIVRWLRT